jgi:copper homeostasis protein
MIPVLEICCYNYRSAIIAYEAGAHRIELCADPAGGGVTPDLGTLKLVREKVPIALYPIIRPRAGDFLYSEEEFEIMLNNIILCRQIQCDGVVIGILHADGTVDKSRCKKLVEAAYPMGVTFHRAFDRAADPVSALDAIIETGCERVLTSGQRPNAMDGSALLKQLIDYRGTEIIIMPGSGVRAANIVTIAAVTGATEFHSSAGIHVRSEMKFIQSSMEESNDLVIASDTEIRGMLQALQSVHQQTTAG